MRFVLQKNDSKRKDAELVLGVLLIPILLAVLLLAAFFLPESMIPRCHLYQHYGIPCPACGSSRAMQLIFSGDFAEAFHIQPFMIIGGLCLMAYSIYSYLVVFGKTPALRIVEISRTNRLMIIAAAVLLVTADWLYLLWIGL